ncbi:glycosyltransferase family 2 protein [Kitasatospora sp. NPDC088391]|uniref:glycosyltransferase family 2 protein n=1 Tax=Kitasatospora sp. NPDC088391 TaxID=3364074 RepID=UPI003820768E
MSPAPATVTVVVCAYTLDRWNDIEAAVASVRAQQRPVDELLLIADHNPELAAKAAGLEGVTVLANSGPRGLSGARNTGVAAARGEIVCFLDDDATAAPDWTSRLLDGYRDPAVLGVGGLVAPRWDGGRPGWFPPEFDWVVGCTHRGTPRRPAAVRNLIGANMSFRRAALREAGGFRTELGRIGTRPLGCEETELCLRLTRRHPGTRLRYDPAAVVRHHVPETRAAWAYFRARCWAEGRSKARVARLAGPHGALAEERRHLRRTLPAALARDLRHARLTRAAALCAGTALTVLGYAADTAAAPHLGRRP